MSTNIDLKALERKAFKSFHQDGLIDIYLGLLLLLASAMLGPFQVVFATTMPRFIAYFVIVMLAWGIYWGGKKFVTTPRIGRARFGPGRKRKIGWTRTALVVSVFLTVVFVVVTAFSQESPSLADFVRSYWLPVLFGLKIVVVFGLMAYFLDFERLYVYGVLFALAIAGDIALHRPIAFAVAGLPMLVAGSIVFVRFLRAYPLPTAGTLDGSQ